MKPKITIKDTAMISTEQLHKAIEECVQKRPSGQSVVFTSKFVEALARELLANREAQPVGFISAKHGPVLYGDHLGLTAGTHFYTAPQAPALQKDVEAVVSLLEAGEWAEHCTNTELGQRLKSAVTALMTNAPSAPEVSGE
ncbi:hypothetical protein I5P78_16715 [Serratia marcescens]|nr:hypothetical protein [Serratia marcescens]